MEMAHFIDWHDEFRQHPERWVNHGRQAAEDSCRHKSQDKDSNIDNRETNMRYSGYCQQCGFSEDDCEPMMNYGYPLYGLPDDVLLSRASCSLSSAQRRFTVLFGMGRGGSTSLWSSGMTCRLAALR